MINHGPWHTFLLSTKDHNILNLLLAKNVAKLYMYATYGDYDSAVTAVALLLMFYKKFVNHKTALGRNIMLKNIEYVS